MTLACLRFADSCSAWANPSMIPTSWTFLRMKCMSSVENSPASNASQTLLNENTV